MKNRTNLRQLAAIAAARPVLVLPATAADLDALAASAPAPSLPARQRPARKRATGKLRK